VFGDLAGNAEGKQRGARICGFGGSGCRPGKCCDREGVLQRTVVFIILIDRIAKERKGRRVGFLFSAFDIQTPSSNFQVEYSVPPA